MRIRHPGTNGACLFSYARGAWKKDDVPGFVNKNLHFVASTTGATKTNRRNDQARLDLQTFLTHFLLLLKGGRSGHAKNCQSGTANSDDAA
jgi:hypothetical protein